jgi:hypothetical protein
MGVPVREFEGHLDPFPAFGGDRLGLGLQLLGDQAVEETDILQPAAIVLLEKIAHDAASGRLIGLRPDELRPLIRGRTVVSVSMRRIW